MAEETPREIDLMGHICPYCIMQIIQAVDLMQPGDTLKFLVDDPLATRST